MAEPSRPAGRIRPERWPTERPLFVAVLLSALLMWTVLLVTIVGALYGVMIGAFFFLSHVAFVSHVRGSGIKLGPDQFPELHARVVELARAMEMDPPPDAYVMQAGGALNAFATRFFGRNMVILYSDLLEACGDNPGARDMILAHELGHLKCGHLRMAWLLLPGYFVPFLGSALSRAREYTCDRFGMAGAGNARDAIHGLAILSAGPKMASQVNVASFVRQREDMNSGWMTIGEWFSSHPPLSKRIAALDPRIVPERFHPTRGRAMALGILLSTVVLGGAATGAAVVFGQGVMEAVEQMDPASGVMGAGVSVADPEAAAEQVRVDLREISEFIDREWQPGALPITIGEVAERWWARGLDDFPADPFSGLWYEYQTDGQDYVLWSRGPDGVTGTPDDVGFSK